jgi:hypothetical protein
MDVAELKRWSLNTGQRVTLPDGSVFNSAGRRVESAKKPAPKPVTVEQQSPAVEPPKPQEDGRIAELVKANEMLATAVLDLRQQLKEMRSVKDQKPVVVAEPKNPEPAVSAPTSWDFEITRDKDGYISAVKAKPVVGEESDDVASQALRIIKRRA